MSEAIKYPEVQVQLTGNDGIAFAFIMEEAWEKHT